MAGKEPKDAPDGRDVRRAMSQETPQAYLSGRREILRPCGPQDDKECGERCVRGNWVSPGAGFFPASGL
jgi:hypothetical protein